MGEAHGEAIDTTQRDLIEKRAHQIHDWFLTGDVSALGALEVNELPLCRVEALGDAPNVYTWTGRGLPIGSYFSDVALDDVDEIVVWCIVDDRLRRLFPGDDPKTANAIAARVYELRGPFAPPTASDRALWASRTVPARAAA